MRFDARRGDVMFPDENGDLPSPDPVDGIVVGAANLLIAVDRVIAHVVKWRPRWYSRVLARAVGARSRITTGADEW
jgi:hypothetical protein